MQKGNLCEIWHTELKVINDYKNGDRIRQMYEHNNYEPDWKHMITAKYDELEHRFPLLILSKQFRSQNVQISCFLLIEKSQKKMKCEFLENPRWLRRCKIPNGISFISICGESNQVS